MRSFLQLALIAILVAAAAAQFAFAEDRPPNIVYIMSDELAYYELSHMGNPHIRTPNIDRMARQGIRFTQALAAAPVCAPLRCALMTGKHMGHASVRANDGGTPLRADEPTIASMLKQKGYATGGFGKWGAGGRDSTGVPEKHGFDVFFGYYDQVHAHSFYPPYLVRNSEEVKLPGNIGGRSGETYSHYEIMEAGLNFIRENKDRPFFCYLPITPPHGMYDIPSDDPAWKLYADDKWVKDPKIAQDVKNYAAMVSMVDRNVGEVIALLKELELEDNTIVFFTGDNGGQDRFRSDDHPRGFFGPNVNPKTGVGFRGGKGSLYEGGLRIPFIVRWPGKIKPGQVSDLLFYQPDVLPTLAELTGAKPPVDIDGLSILPTLLGADVVGHEQEQHEFLYWEYGSQTAVRMGKWKAVQAKKNGKWGLWNLAVDVSESNDIFNKHPDIVARAKAIAEKSHEPVRAGSYGNRTRHQRDRRAKWGTSRRKTNAVAPLPRIGIKPPTTAQAEEFKLDASFYKRAAAVQDILIVTSAAVSNHTIRESAYQFDMIMRSIDPAVAQRIRDRRVLCILIGHDELTSDLPQFATEKTGKDLDFYNWRQRGFLTHKQGRPIVVFAEEDVLEYEGGMQLESILIHEFGHVIHGAGFDKALQQRLTDTFERARAKGIWMDGRAAQRFRRVKSETPVSLFDALLKSFPDQPPELIKQCLDGGDILVNGKATDAGAKVTKDDKVLIVFGGPKECYAHKNRAEYWAEGVQCWYNTNRTMDHDHNHIHTREQLKTYDPHLAKLCEEVLGDSPWRFVSPRERAGRDHLKDFDPSRSPNVVDPEHIQTAALDYYDKYWSDYWRRLRQKYSKCE